MKVVCTGQLFGRIVRSLVQQLDPGVRPHDGIHKLWIWCWVDCDSVNLRHAASGFIAQGISTQSGGASVIDPLLAGWRVSLRQVLRNSIRISFRASRSRKLSALLVSFSNRLEI